MILYFYEKIFTYIFKFLILFRIFLRSEKSKRFLYLRSEASLKDTFEKFSAIDNSFWLHVASAGELEQVVPICAKIFARTGTKFIVSYFSPSTEKFLNGHPWIHASFGLPLDIQKNHQMVTNHFGVKKIFFVRYDFWPSLISFAKKSKIELILLACSLPQERTKIKTWYRKYFVLHFDKIFCITKEDQQYLNNTAKSSEVFLSGDAKWARAKERANKKSENSNFQILENFVQQNRNNPVVIFGSPHKEEIEIIKNSVTLHKKITIIITPHSIQENDILEIKNIFLKHDIKSILFSEIEDKVTNRNWINSNQKESYVNDNKIHKQKFEIETKIIIIDKIGFLAEAYGTADIAIIGGGFDGMLHNVLEAAAHPTATLFGNRLNRSPEARLLVTNQAAKSFTSTDELFEFLKMCASLENNHVLMELKSNAQALFDAVPNTSEVVLEACFPTT